LQARLSIKLFLSVFLITFVFYSKSLSFSFVWDDFANFNTLSQMSLSDVIKPSPKVISLSTLFASNWRPLTNGIFVLFNNFPPPIRAFYKSLGILFRFRDPRDNYSETYEKLPTIPNPFPPFLLTSRKCGKCSLALLVFPLPPRLLTFPILPHFPKISPLRHSLLLSFTL